jgi:hypothetical protein
MTQAIATVADCLYQDKLSNGVVLVLDRSLIPTFFDDNNYRIVAVTATISVLVAITWPASLARQYTAFITLTGICDTSTDVAKGDQKSRDGQNLFHDVSPLSLSVS